MITQIWGIVRGANIAGLSERDLVELKLDVALLELAYEKADIDMTEQQAFDLRLKKDQIDAALAVVSMTEAARRLRQLNLEDKAEMSRSERRSEREAERKRLEKLLKK
jgi:hypothetical protein